MLSKLQKGDSNPTQTFKSQLSLSEKQMQTGEKKMAASDSPHLCTGFAGFLIASPPPTSPA